MNDGYDSFGFYRRPQDPRLFVPKLNPMMGWTINLSHPRAPAVLLAFGAAIVAAVLAKIFA